MAVKYEKDDVISIVPVIDPFGNARAHTVVLFDSHGVSGHGTAAYCSCMEEEIR